MLVVEPACGDGRDNNRIVFTKRTSAYDELVAVFGPVGAILSAATKMRQRGSYLSGVPPPSKTSKIIAGKRNPASDENSN